MDYRLIREELDGVRTAVRKAVNEWESRFVYGESAQSTAADEEYVQYLLRIAYLSMVAFLDRYQLNKLSEYLSSQWEYSKNNLLDSFMSDYGEMPLLSIASTFWEIIEALGNVTPEDHVHKAGEIDFNLQTILKRIDLSAHKLGIGFNQESDIDKLAEALLQPFFPDLNSTPSLTLGETFRQPDSAIPSIRTLVEYKLIREKQEVAKVIDEMQADIRNYPQAPWEHLVFLVGQTQPFTTEEKLKATLIKEPTTFNTIEIILVTYSAGLKNQSAKMRKVIS